MLSVDEVRDVHSKLDELWDFLNGRAMSKGAGDPQEEQLEDLVRRARNKSEEILHQRERIIGRERRFMRFA